MSRNGPLALAFHTLFIAFLAAPLVTVCWVSFTPEGYLSLPTREFSLRWYRAILDSDFIPATWNSLYVAAASATIALVLSVPAAMATVRWRFPGREALTGFFLSPLMVPHLVLGVATLRFLSEIGFTGTYLGLIMAHVIIVMPFTLRLSMAALVGLNPALEWAAVSLGASNWTAFRRVTLPLIVPGLTGGWLLAFIQSFDEVTLTIFVASPSTRTLPVRMYQHISDNIDPLIAAMSAALIFVTIALMLVLERLYGLDRLLVGKGR